jgi:hypothetical protein
MSAIAAIDALVQQRAKELILKGTFRGDTYRIARITQGSSYDLLLLKSVSRTGWVLERSAVSGGNAPTEMVIDYVTRPRVIMGSLDGREIDAVRDLLPE